ncbi:RPM1-interacting protein 4 [Dendrobium catenatum]|uniref:RPM1-interacting protein 4 n=1 Tax=Dendrobium catenatum TaxID=906689 RepID=A0A2I0X0M1_9ASPA|nr:RPM1-interacting protein 4 [Dendrobium catenatum]
MHITSGTMFNPSGPKGSLGKNSASPQRRPAGTSESHENRAGLYPLRHHHHHQRVANKVGGHSPWEKKSPPEGGHVVAPSTPGRSPLKSILYVFESFKWMNLISHGQPEEGIAVPKFGDWDESNPSSGEAFTDIFNKVQKERQSSATKVPMIIDDSFYLNSYHHETASSRPTLGKEVRIVWHKVISSKAKSQSRRKRPVTVVIDEGMETNTWQSVILLVWAVVPSVSVPIGLCFDALFSPWLLSPQFLFATDFEEFLVAVWVVL